MRGYVSVCDMREFLEQIPKNGSLIEFGTMSGKSISVFLDIAENPPNIILDLSGNSHDIQFEIVYAFDSFEGLPAEANHVWHNPDWVIGAFDSRKVWNVDTVPEVLACLTKKFHKYKTKVALIPGWYKDTLTAKMAEQIIAPVSFISIDTDIYKSCYECMDWLFKYDLAMSNSIWRFDDWNSTPLWTAGESLAHKEITEKYGLKWEQLTDNIFKFIGK